ncbi:MAG: ester cyclase [Thermodesulfobacteriota bacterium]
MDNKELVRLAFEKGCNQQDIEGSLELISEAYMLHDPSQPDFPGGRDAFKEMCGSFMESIRDASCTIEDQVAEGDRVVTRFTFSGCQTKDLPDIPNKGGCFNVSGITISRVADGKIAEEWMTMDELGMRKQLGST